MDRSEIKTMKDYHDLYWKCNVLLLPNAFEKLRNSSLKNYGLCPSHYLSASVSSLNAMLIVIKVDLELISDAEMYLFFEKSIRDRVILHL